MTTLTTRAAERPATALGNGTALAGTGSLIRFALRRDRIRIPVWLAALTMGTIATANSFVDLYGTEAARDNVAQSMSTPAGLAMTGPREYLTDYNFGSMMGHQMLGFMAVMVGLMSVLLLVRHTRAEEESGRAELVRAGIVGRHAQLAAALAVVTGANAALAGLLTLGLGGLGMDGITWDGSALYGAGHAVVGIVFAGVAAVTVQVTEHSRGASGMAFAGIALAYVLRAAGDIGDSLVSWLSPIGWAQATYVYVDDRWWPLAIAVVAAGALTATAFRLSTQRDLGAGLRQPRAGAAVASSALSRPLGFALRLHRGMLIGFVAALFLLGVMYGSVLDQVETMIANVEVIQDVLAELGGTSIVQSFASVIMVVLSIISSVYVVLAVSRMRSEESAGRAEPVLATALSRTRWMASHLAVALLGGAVVLLAAGLGLGAAGAIAIGDASFVATAVSAALAYTPALWVTTGVAAALFGWLPRATAAAWIVVVYAFVVGYVGQLLQFPSWLNNLSPFSHVPQMPAAEFTATPIVVLTVIAAGLLALGAVGFRSRDVEMT
ncbi:MAG: ABC transporter permease [Haloechinothrix sp.]